MNNKNQNRFNKQKKYHSQSPSHVKRPNKFDQQMIQNHPFEAYQKENNNQQIKEQNIKNMFRLYHQQRNLSQYNNQNINENNFEMEIPQMMNKKGAIRGRGGRRQQQKNIYNNENIPEAYTMNLNNIPQKNKNRSLTTDYERGYNKNRVNIKNKNKKVPKKNFYKYENMNYNNVNNNYGGEIINDENYINNYEEVIPENNYNYHNPYDEDEYDIEEDDEETIKNDNNEYNNIYKDEDEDDIIVDDNTNSNKEVLDVNLIKILEKKENDKPKVIPELKEMCSEKEIKERSEDNGKDLDLFELDPKSTPYKVPMKNQMIQKYKRKNGKIVNLTDPKELRDITAINKSNNFIINEIIDSDINKNILFPQELTVGPQDIINFVLDRYNAMFKTIEILINNNSESLYEEITVEVICKMIRVLIIFLNLCLDEYDEPQDILYNKIIKELLKPLLDLIKSIIFNESKNGKKLSINDKDEFLSYILLLELKLNRNNFMNLYNEIKKLINVNASKKINLILNINKMLNEKNYIEFINSLKNDADYLISCLLSLFYKEICFYGINKLSETNKEITYGKLYEYLTFEDIEEIKPFLKWYGIPKNKLGLYISDNDKVPLCFSKNTNFNEAPQKTNLRYTERKRGNKPRKEFVLKKINFVDNENESPKKENNKITKNSLISSDDIDKNSSSINNLNNNINDNNKNIEPVIITNNIDTKKTSNFIVKNTNKNLNDSFISGGSLKELFDTSNNKKPANNESKIFNKDKNFNNISNDTFLKPLTPKKNNETENINTNNKSDVSFLFDKDSKPDTKSFDAFSRISLSSINEPKNLCCYYNEETIGLFCDISSKIIEKILLSRKFDFLYELKLNVEKYKIKLGLIENYIKRRKFFVFNELKKCCLNAKYSKEYLNQIINYNNNLNSTNTQENIALKDINDNISINSKFEFLTFEDLKYFLIKDYVKFDENKDYNFSCNIDNLPNDDMIIKHLQINIYTTRELIKSTKILSTLKINKNLIKENNDGTELIIKDEIIITGVNKLFLIIKFIFIDQIIDLDSYIYGNQKNISKYSILIPFFDIIKCDPENQQILTKFFTILDIGLGNFLKKDIIFIFPRLDIEKNSSLYEDYINIQNEFMQNLTNKYSYDNNFIYLYDSSEKNKQKIIYLSPVNEFGKCHQEYIKYMNNKTFVELFENNKLFHLNVFNNSILIPFEKHINSLNIIIMYYISKIQTDLYYHFMQNNLITYYHNNKLIFEILIGVAVCKLLITYYEFISISFSNELFKIPSFNSSNDLFMLEDNLLNAGRMFSQINSQGYQVFFEKCFEIKNNNKNNLIYFDIFSTIISSYHLISDVDINEYEFIFKKQYYDKNIEKNKYEISKRFIEYFNKIILKFTTTNNLRVKEFNIENTFKKIYEKNKIMLIKNLTKIITGLDINFNDSKIYIESITNVYEGIQEIEYKDYNNRLNKKRKRTVDSCELKNVLKKETKINNLFKNNKICKKENNYNLMDIEESLDENETSIEKNNIGDMNEEYKNDFCSIKKFVFPTSL